MDHNESHPYNLHRSRLADRDWFSYIFPRFHSSTVRKADPTLATHAARRPGDEFVAGSADGQEVAGVGGVGFEVVAQADDEIVDGARGG